MNYLMLRCSPPDRCFIDRSTPIAGFACFRLVHVAAPPRVYRVGLTTNEQADLDSPGVNA
jgi:hypothetical protein